MAISVVGTPASASTTTVTVPTHAVGDYIVIVALRSATTAPTLPAGYTQIVTGSGNSNSYRVGYKIATATNDTSGTWTNASLLLCTVYTGVSGIGASSAATKAASTTATIPTITISNQNSKSWVVTFAGHAATSTQGTPLVGATTSRVTQTSGTYNGGMFDTNAGVNSFSATTSSNTTSVVSSGGTFELMSTDSMSTFTDPLTASTQNTTLWGNNFGTLSWSPSGFTITNPSAYTGYGGEVSNLRYDLTGSAFYCNMPTAASQLLTSSETSPIQLLLDSLNLLEIYINSGTIQAHYRVNGSNTFLGSTAYVPLTMTWFKISESGGTITWSYGSNGTSWTTLATVANPIVITALQVQPVMGTFNSEVSSTTAVWNSFNTAPSAPSVSITQIAATLTAAQGTHALATVNTSAISQSAATLLASGGTQVVASIQTKAITQVAASLTATGNSQAVSNVNIVGINQIAAAITATNGVQLVAAIIVASASVAQTTASITTTGGSQTVASSQIASVTQTGANVTISGGTQAISSINDSSVTQLASVLTATGGVQVVDTVNNSTPNQVAAAVTASGGVQVVTSSQIIGIAQVTGNVTATPGTQSISAVNIVGIAQTAAVVIANGGMQSISTGSGSADASVVQIFASITATGGIHDVEALQDTNIAQSGGTLLASTGTQLGVAQLASSTSQVAASTSMNGGTQSIGTINTITIAQATATLTILGYAPTLYIGIPVGDGIGSAVWVVGSDPNSSTVSTGGHTINSSFIPDSIQTVAVAPGDQVDSATWTPSN